MSTKGFKKTKAYGLVGFIAFFTALAMAQGVQADEISADTTVPTETVAVEQTEPVADTEATNDQPAVDGLAETSTEATKTTFEKSGDEIKVTNPDVKMEFPNGYGKYSRNQVTYQVDFPDDLTINENDKVIFDLPKEVGLQTSYSFDVYNPDKQVIGKATADAQASTITTVFNDYFASHPLKKSMSLQLDTKWADVVTPGKTVDVNFNGTIQHVTIGQQQEIGQDEIIDKWGSQDKDDPTIINWAMRLNYSRRLLNNLRIIDTMSDNQVLVDDYLVMNYVDSVDPWIDKGSALDLIKSISKSEHGFEIKMDRLDRMVYIWYKTKLVNPVSESTNPTNSVRVIADDVTADDASRVQLVGGRGDAKGEDKPKPTWSVPGEAPTAEKPEYPLDQVPQYHEVPGEAPTADKPEFPLDQVPQYHEVPNYAPTAEKPEFPLDLVPKPQPEPKDDPKKPEDKPKEDPKQDKPKENPKKDQPKKEDAPKTHKERHSNVPEPRKEQSNVIVPEEVETPENANESVTAALPETGSESGLAMMAFGAFGATLSIMIGLLGKMKKEEE